MQIILNFVLREHGTPVPGTAGVPLPMDISRSLACTSNDSFNNPEIVTVDASAIGMGEFQITDCHDNFLNFFNDFGEIENLTQTFPQFLPEGFENLALALTLLTYARPQDLLFDFPMFYIGK